MFNKLFENVAKFKDLGTTLEKLNDVHNEHSFIVD
jgi:hypothetical protein